MKINPEFQPSSIPSLFPTKEGYVPRVSRHGVVSVTPQTPDRVFSKRQREPHAITPRNVQQRSQYPITVTEEENTAAAAWLDLVNDPLFQSLCKQYGADPKTLVAHPNAQFSVTGTVNGRTSPVLFSLFNSNFSLPTQSDLNSQPWTTSMSLLLRYAYALDRDVDRTSVNLSKMNGMSVDDLLTRAGPITSAADRIMSASKMLGVFSELYRETGTQNRKPSSDNRFNFNFEQFSRRFLETDKMSHLTGWLTGFGNENLSPRLGLKTLGKLADTLKDRYASNVVFPKNDSSEGKAAFRKAFREAVVSGAKQDGVKLSPRVVDFAANVLYCIHQEANKTRPLPLSAPSVPPPSPASSSPSTPSSSPPDPDRPWIKAAEVATIQGALTVFAGGNVSLSPTAREALGVLGNGIAAGGAIALAALMPGVAGAAGSAGATSLFYSSVVRFLESRGIPLNLASRVAVVELGGVYILVGLGAYQSYKSLKEFAQHPSWKGALNVVSNIITTAATYISGAPAAAESEQFNVENPQYGFFEANPNVPAPDTLGNAGNLGITLGLGGMFAADNIPDEPWFPKERAPVPQNKKDWSWFQWFLSFYDPSGSRS